MQIKLHFGCHPLQNAFFCRTFALRKIVPRIIRIEDNTRINNI